MFMPDIWYMSPIVPSLEMTTTSYFSLYPYPQDLPWFFFFTIELGIRLFTILYRLLF